MSVRDQSAACSYDTWIKTTEDNSIALSLHFIRYLIQRLSALCIYNQGQQYHTIFVSLIKSFVLKLDQNSLNLW